MGQNCFTELADFSGFETSPYQSELEIAACELIEAFPTEFQDNFHIYDYGFYRINKHTEGNLQADWNRVIQEVDSLSPYYLLFGKESDETGVYKKFWIEIKLPTDWLSQCFDNSYISILQNSIIFQLNQVNYSQNPIHYANYEKECMSILKSKIEELADCCQPELKSEDLCNSCITDNDVDLFFLNSEFDTLGIEILNPDTTIIEDCLCQEEAVSLSKNNSEFPSASTYVDFTHGYVLNLNGTIIDLPSKAIKLLNIYEETSGIITHNVNYCQEDFDALMDTFNSSDKAFWFHVSNNRLFYKVKGVGDELKIGTCNSQNRDILECILDRFETTEANLFEEILNVFDNKNKDIIINVDCPPGDTTAQGQTIDELLARSGIIEIYLHPNQFENIETYPFRPAATLIHEMCHGLLSLHVLIAGGPAQCNFLQYSYYYGSYGNIGQTDECIMARHFVDRQAKLFWLYNSKHMEQKYYLSSAWGPYFYDYKSCNDNVNYTQSQISSWYLEMRDSSPFLPCINE